MLRLHTYARGQLTTTDAPEQIAPPADGARLWVEAVEPKPAELELVSRGLGLHELSLQDALRAGHPPKLEDFGDHLFFIARTPTESDGPTTRKVAVFLARDWIVTIARLRLRPLEEAVERIRANPERYLADPGFLAHHLLFVFTERFEDLTDRYLDRVEALEDDAASNARPETLARILESSREVTRFTRVLRHQRELCQALVQQSHPALPRKVQPYLRDVYDQTLHLYDLLEGVRDGIASARVTYLSAVNNRLGDVMRTLTVIATVLMPLTVVTGVFGMNFRHVPGLDSPLGFWITLAAMAGLGVGMFLWFRRRHWL